MLNDKQRNTPLASIISVAGSGKSAIFLILLLAAFCLTGAILPQEGRFAAHEITTWQKAHPLAASLFSSTGGFRVFHSFPFFSVVVLLSVNTLTCTLLRLKRLIGAGTISIFRGLDGLRHIGFLVLHLSLLLLFLGGALSSTLGMDGILVLTETMSLTEQHDSYVKLVEGIFRQEKHTGFTMQLVNVTEKIADDYPVEQTTGLIFGDRGHTIQNVEAGYNKPCRYKGIDITLDTIGYAPEVEIFERGGLVMQRLLQAPVILKTSGRGPEARHRDFVADKLFYDRNQRLFLTVYPSSATVDNTPLLLVDLADKTRNSDYHTEIPLHGSGMAGEYLIYFRGLKRWASFRVMDDPGYPVVLTGLWLGLIGIVLRYIPELLNVRFRDNKQASRE